VPIYVEETKFGFLIY